MNNIYFLKNEFTEYQKKINCMSKPNLLEEEANWREKTDIDGFDFNSIKKGLIIYKALHSLAVTASLKALSESKIRHLNRLKGEL